MLVIGVCLAPPSAEAGSCPNSGLPGTPYEGFGADTPGGAGKEVYRVTTLADAGRGSLRDALASGNRCIEFEVAGDIVLQKQIYVRGAFLTVDGFSAPAPGITVRGYGISVWGTLGAHDVILRGLRLRNAGVQNCASGDCWDGLQIKEGTYRVVLDHISSDNSGDGGIDIAGSNDITVQWSVVSGTRMQSLIKRSSRVSMHHNLFIHGQTRNPQADWDDTLATAPSDTVLDFRNNLIWDFTAYGTIVRQRATANVVNNYYYSATRLTAGQALSVDQQGRLHSAGNHSGNGVNLNAQGAEPKAFRAEPVITSDACGAAYDVQDDAGARGVELSLDSIDRGHFAKLPSQFPGCAVASPAPETPASSPSSPPPSVPSADSKPPATSDVVMTSLSLPGTVYQGTTFPIKFGVTNRGNGPSANGRIRIYLSKDGRSSSEDVLLRDRHAPSIPPGASQWHSLSEVVPTGVKPGSYFVVLGLEPESTARVAAQRTNLTAAPVTISQVVASKPAPDLVTTGVSIPSVLRRGAGFPVKFTVVNRGTGAAPSTRVRIYLSTDGGVSSRDVLLRTRTLTPLNAGASQVHSLTEVIPSNVRTGSYQLLLVVDWPDAVSESNEGNNVARTSVSVR
jgi:hypothetical protein